MTTLGKYLLTSLFFVFAALMEFAVVILITRRKTSRKKEQNCHTVHALESSKQDKKRSSNENDETRRAQGPDDVDGDFDDDNCPDVKTEDTTLNDYSFVGYESDCRTMTKNSFEIRPVFLPDNGMDESKETNKLATKYNHYSCSNDLTASKVDTIAIALYFILFGLFNVAYIVIYVVLNQGEISGPDGRHHNGRILPCHCKSVNGGMNPAWELISEKEKELCNT